MKSEGELEALFLSILQAFSQECIPKKSFSYFSTKTYVVGTRKNLLNEFF